MIIKRFYKDPVLLLTVFIWLLALIIINPIGDFSINDDWAYSWGVCNLNNGDFKLSDWNSASFIAQLFWGFGWSKVFGFSFSILRISTLFLSLIGIIILNKILLNFNINKDLRLFS